MTSAPVTWHGLRVGPLLMVLAGLSFTLMVAFVKVARQELSALDVVLWRGLVAVPFAVAFVWGAPLTLRRPGLFAVRCVFGFLAMNGYFFAAKGLAVTDQTLFGKLQPVFIAVLAPFLLGRREGGGLVAWLAIGLGLVGSVILLAPELQVGSVYGLAAFGGAFAAALAHLSVRRLTATDAPATLVLWFQVVLTIAAVPFVLVSEGGLVLPEPSLWLPLAGVGVFAAGGQILMTHAYRLDRAPIIAAADYLSPLWAVGIDLVAFGLIPGWHALVGGVLVIAAGLWLVVQR